MHLLPTKFYVQRAKNYLWHLPKSLIANLFYGFPSRKLILIGVTGTDGKTTTSTLIYHCLINAGFKADLITTINSPGLHTTSPDPMLLQKMFSDLVKKGVTHCVVETTAHGLDQFRFFGCKFYTSLITNVSHEHLDDFPTLDFYAKAKSTLFRQSINKIFNHDDNYFKYFNRQFPKNITYSIESKSDYQATNIYLDSNKMTFDVNQLKITTDSNYRYQIYNILAALAVTDTLKISTTVFLKTVKKFPETKGRREIVNNDLKIKTIVDFAHTPRALEQTLLSLRQVSKGKLICIFGATGGRDQTKRPLMGKVVSQNSDIAIITADDTRNEKVEDINRQIISGIIESKNFKYYNIPSRQDAFNLAVKLAKPGDTIVACGKGHETTILHGATEFPWSETEAFRTAFRSLQK